ncbi:hypothetical protein MACJ_002293 [Theileria orientalis]|uniref:Uncharacterized protein n=1 Tax=Theileria orientalis TaxID=68886 RepID=A0A976M5Y6_THEOR|nr:hypothetical protein MACJ_002293 [Theileria orientalis]
MIDLEEIQVQNYKSVNVYFGSKAKITSSKGNIEENVPLMVELVKLDKPKQCEYYCHHQNKKGLYWEKLDVFNYEKYTGIKLKVPNRLGNLTKNSTHFLRLLKRLESYFLKTLVIMINKQKLYKNLDVLVSYDDYNKSRIINGIGDLPVTDTTQLKNCLENTGFKVFEHDLSHFELNYESYQLKFIIPSTYNMSKYNEITLNSSNNSRYENIENLNYQSGNGEDNIQVYFYDKDPRPLLVSFGEKGFRPRNKDKYSTEWVAIEDFDDYSEGDGVSLLKHLSEVVGFLNEVNICEHSDNYYNGSDYEIHTYDNTRIYLNVTRVYFDCYIKYEHRPKIDQGYRLGNIVYKKENKKKGYIIYNYTIPLIQVNVYYYNNDIKHSYPLLVELEFKNNDDSSLNRSKLHYKLLKSDFHVMNWEIDHNASRIADQRQKLREHLDLVKHSFDNVPELKGFINNCGHNHLLNPTFLNKSYITRSHGTDDSAHGSSSSYEDHVRSDSSHARSHSPRREVLTINHQQGGMQSSQHVHGNQAPPESGVEKATRIASTVGTFAIAVEFADTSAGDNLSSGSGAHLTNGGSDACLAAGERPEDGSSATVEVKLFKDDGNGNAVEMETNDFLHDFYLGNLTYAFDPDIKCILVKFGNSKVWKKGDGIVQLPKSVTYDSILGEVAVRDADNSVYFKKDTSTGEWKHFITISRTKMGMSGSTGIPESAEGSGEAQETSNDTSEEADQTDTSGSAEALEKEAFEGFSVSFGEADGGTVKPGKDGTPTTPASETTYSGTKTGVDLSLKATSAKKEFNYTKSGRVLTYTAKDNYGFKSVKTKDKVVWRTTNASEYATKVVLNGKGKKDKTVTIYLPNNTRKVFKRENKNKTRIEVIQPAMDPVKTPNITPSSKADGRVLVKTPPGNTNEKEGSNNLSGDSPPTFQLKPFKDDGNGNAVEMETNDFLHDFYLGNLTYAFDPDIKCILVKFGNSKVWEKGDHGVNQPKSVSYTFMHRIVVRDAKTYLVYRKDNSGNWVLHNKTENRN